MAVTFDGPNLLLIFETGVVNYDVQIDWYQEWKDWLLLSSENRKHSAAFSNSVGGDELNGALDSGAYFFFRNDLGWRMRPAEEDANISVTSNIIPADSSLPLIIPTIGNFTVLINGLQPITQNVDKIAGFVWEEDIQVHRNAGTTGQVQHSSLYALKQVFINTDSLVNGDGSALSPFNDLGDALDFAELRGFTTLSILADVTLDRNLKNFTVSGVADPIVDLNGQDVDKSKFMNCELTGIGLGTVATIDCALTNCTLAGRHRSPSVNGTYTVSVNGTTFLHLGHCGAGPITIDVGAADIILAALDADVIFTNITTGSVSVDFLAGICTIDAACTGGTFKIGGSVKFTDNSAGTVIDTSGLNKSLIWDAKQADHVTNGTTGKTLRDANSNAEAALVTGL